MQIYDSLILLNCVFSVTLKYIMLAHNELQKSNKNESEHNASLLQRVLAMEPDNPKLATILALDMFLVGIDTVRQIVHPNII